MNHIIKKSGFTKEGNWYKGNLHSHTTNSDGKLTPEEAVELYKGEGYHFLCFSEHDRFTDYRESFNTEDFIILPGLEASALLINDASNTSCKKLHHIHGILGTSQMQKEAKQPGLSHMEYLNPGIFYEEWDGAKVAQELCSKLQDMGYITIYNHPVWSRVRSEEFVHTAGLTGVEIFNYNTVNESGTGYDTSCWDLMLREGRQILGFASDDNHNEGIFKDSCGGYIMVKAEELSHDQIIENIMAGNFYSTAGPQIYDWGIENGVVYVECSPVNRINFIAGNFVNAGTTVMCDELDETITKASFTLKGMETYIRVECIDCYGRTAWSNPIYFE